MILLLLALCRHRTLGSERHRYANALLPDKLGSDQMAVDGILYGGRGWSGKAGGIPGASNIIFSLGVENMSGLTRDGTAEPA